jgi:hypothetical protein
MDQTRRRVSRIDLSQYWQSILPPECNSLVTELIIRKSVLNPILAGAIWPCAAHAQVKIWPA